MNTNSQFLSHLRHSGEIIKDWPSWKTKMWETEDNEPAKDYPSYHQIPQKLLWWQRPFKG